MGTRSVTEPGRHVMFLAYEGDGVLGSDLWPPRPDPERAGESRWDGGILI
jgi:hypothetical protein